MYISITKSTEDWEDCPVPEFEYRSSDWKDVENLLMALPTIAAQLPDEVVFKFLKISIICKNIGLFETILNKINNEEKKRKVLTMRFGFGWIGELNTSTLHKAVISSDLSDEEHLAILKIIMKYAGKKPYMKKSLQHSAIKGHLKTFLHFFKKVNIDEFAEYFSWFCRLNNFRHIQLLWFRFGKNLELNGNTWLHFAAESSNERILKMILDFETKDRKESGINAKNTEDETPLFLAVRSRSLDNIKLLLANGADINVLNAKGESPLQLALQIMDKKDEEDKRDKKVTKK